MYCIFRKIWLLNLGKIAINKEFLQCEATMHIHISFSASKIRLQKVSSYIHKKSRPKYKWLKMPIKPTVTTRNVTAKKPSTSKWISFKSITFQSLPLQFIFLTSIFVTRDRNSNLQFFISTCVKQSLGRDWSFWTWVVKGWLEFGGKDFDITGLFTLDGWVLLLTLLRMYTFGINVSCLFNIGNGILTWKIWKKSIHYYMYIYTMIKLVQHKNDILYWS